MGKVVKAVITGGKEQFGIWLENIDGIYGAGDTLEEAKENLLEAISLYKQESNDIPEVLKSDFVIEYTFDASGFLKYYSKFISFAAMKEITGVNQKQLWNYANGYRKPSQETTEKIFSRIINFSKELGQAQLRF